MAALRRRPSLHDVKLKELAGGDGLMKETFGTKALGIMRSHHVAYDMILFSDFGYTQDDEKALAMLVALQRLGLVAKLGVVANTSNAVDRALLAKGTLKTMNAGDVPVAVGASAGQSSKSRMLPDGTITATGGLRFEGCDYLARPDELYHGGKPDSGVELVFEAIAAAKAGGRKLTIACASAMTDMAQCLHHPRWAKEAPGVVTAITVMCGAAHSSGGITLDEEAQNARFDLNSARFLYSKLQAQREIRFTVVTRHSAPGCRLQRNALTGSLHPVAKRLAATGRPNLLALWKRTHLTAKERKKKKDTLPISRDVQWFRKVFLLPDAPPLLGPDDDVWNHFVGFNEYDGLAAVVAATAPSEKLFGQFFQPFVCPKTGTLVLGQAEGDSGIGDEGLVRELLHDLIVVALGGGGGDWVERIAELGGKSKQRVDLLMYGDFGKDQDDEKALAMAVTLQHAGCLARISVVSNLGDSKMRARLAKGTLNVLEARDTAVAVGSDGGRAGDKIHEYEFAGCTYLAAESELFPGSGVELGFDAMRNAKAAGHQLTIVCNSAMTDLALLLDSPGWAEAARGTVGGVVMMGGALLEPGSGVSLDETAQNNAFDLVAARRVFAHFSAAPEVELVVLTRHSAAACQLPRSAFDGSPHALGVRLTTVAKPSLQKLWERTHRSEVEREAIKDALPMRCDAAWFRSTFIEPDCPKGLTGADDVWPYVKGFNEYDGLATIAAATLLSPELFALFFAPFTCPTTATRVIGISKDEPGIKDAAKACELLHDLMVNALDQRKPGQQILYRLDGAAAAERPIILRRPLRRKGPDCWLAELQLSPANLGSLLRDGLRDGLLRLPGMIPSCLVRGDKRAGCFGGVGGGPGRCLVEVYLSEATQDEMWRLGPT